MIMADNSVKARNLIDLSTRRLSHTSNFCRGIVSWETVPFLHDDIFVSTFELHKFRNHSTVKWFNVGSGSFYGPSLLAINFQIASLKFNLHNNNNFHLRSISHDHYQVKLILTPLSRISLKFLFKLHD